MPARQNGLDREFMKWMGLLWFTQVGPVPSIDYLTIRNEGVGFEKRDVYKYTWQHPGSKLWHRIDYILMRQCQREFCHDVSVLCRADCWISHKLMRAKLSLTCARCVPQQPIRRGFSAYKLHDDNIHCAFVGAAVMKVRSGWREDMPDS